jgi:cbb3-type cytochrome c oxidase subunit III
MNVNKPKEDFTRYLALGLAFTAIILVAVGIVTALESPRLAEAANETSIEGVNQGRKIYQQQCATCHGSQGEGGVGPPLNSKKLLQDTVDDVLFSIIRSGVPTTQMPAWSVAYGGPLTDQDVRHVVAFIRSWEPNAPLIEAPVFEPSAERGALTFNTTCATCHGTDGSGTNSAAALNDGQKLAVLDDETFQAAVLNGLPANGMPGYNGLFTAEQLADLTALVDAWRQGQQIATPYKITDEVTAAMFALQQDDADSAKLRVQNAMSVASGVAATKLTDIAGQLERGNTANAQALLVSFNKQWPMGDAANGQTLCAKCALPRAKGGGRDLKESERFRITKQMPNCGLC